MMPVGRVSPYSLQIRRFGMVNCYLVSEDDGLTLVDTAMGAARIIIEAARQLQKPIRRVALTHGHMDHVGSVNALRKRLVHQQVQLLAGEREALILEEASRGVKPKQMTLLEGEPQDPVRGGFPKLNTQPDTKLHQGDTVGSLKVVATPGHTPGHIAFFDERDGSLYAGDGLMTFGGVRLPFDPPWYFPFVKMGTWHYPTTLASARKLLAFEVKRVLAGHGPALEISAAALTAAIEHGERVR